MLIEGMLPIKPLTLAIGNETVCPWAGCPDPTNKRSINLWVSHCRLTHDEFWPYLLCPLVASDWDGLSPVENACHKFMTTTKEVTNHLELKHQRAIGPATNRYCDAVKEGIPLNPWVVRRNNKLILLK
jgi:hypothetical protein